MTYQNTYLGYGKPANGKILYIGFKEVGDFKGNFFQSNPTTSCPHTYCGLIPCGHTSCRIRTWEDNFKRPFVDLSSQTNLESGHADDHILRFTFDIPIWKMLSVISMSAEGLISSCADKTTILPAITSPNNYTPYHSISKIEKRFGYHKYKMFQDHSNDCIAHIELPFLPLHLQHSRIIMPLLCSNLIKYE